LKDMGVERRRSGAELGVPPGNYTPPQTPGEKDLLRIEGKRDIVVKELFPTDKQWKEESCY